MGLKEALDKLEGTVADFTSLHVQTFSGNINFTSKNSSFDNVHELIKKTGTDSNADITLVAESFFKFDGDSYNFMADKENGIPSSAMELHNAAVEAGIKTRHGLLQMIKGVFS